MDPSVKSLQDLRWHLANFHSLVAQRLNQLRHGLPWSLDLHQRATVEMLDKLQERFNPLLNALGGTVVMPVAPTQLLRNELGGPLGYPRHDAQPLFRWVRPSANCRPVGFHPRRGRLSRADRTSELPLPPRGASDAQPSDVRAWSGESRRRGLPQRSRSTRVPVSKILRLRLGNLLLPDIHRPPRRIPGGVRRFVPIRDKSVGLSQARLVGDSYSGSASGTFTPDGSGRRSGIVRSPLDGLSASNRLEYALSGDLVGGPFRNSRLSGARHEELQPKHPRRSNQRSTDYRCIQPHRESPPHCRRKSFGLQAIRTHGSTP